MFTSISGITAETPTELQCLTANIFFEARGESTKGMKAIADITLNRTKHQAFPESICEVVKQKQQFSWVKGDKRSKKVLSEDLRGFKTEDLAAYQKAKVIATEALSEGYKPTLPKNIVSFHNASVQPAWSKVMKLHGKIGQHYFYSFKRKIVKNLKNQ
jgi:spore germination cell wall hydrolase CwlJ-like protein